MACAEKHVLCSFWQTNRYKKLSIVLAPTTELLDSTRLDSTRLDSTRRDEMTASSCVYIAATIALALLTVCNSAAVVGEIRATVRAQSANLQKRDPQNVLDFTTNGGSIQYTTRTFPGESPSPSGVTATVNNQIRLSGIGSKPDKDIKPRGYNQLGAGWQRCHLIDRSLGGSGKDARNLFACTKFTNVVVMRHYEKKLRTYLKNNPQALVTYEVKLIYFSLDYPNAIQMKATVGNTILLDIVLTNRDEASVFVQVSQCGILTKNNPVPSVLQNTSKWTNPTC